MQRLAAAVSAARVRPPQQLAGPAADGAAAVAAAALLRGVETRRRARGRAGATLSDFRGALS